MPPDPELPEPERPEPELLFRGAGAGACLLGRDRTGDLAVARASAIGGLRHSRAAAMTGLRQ